MFDGISKRTSEVNMSKYSTHDSNIHFSHLSGYFSDIFRRIIFLNLHPHQEGTFFLSFILGSGFAWFCLSLWIIPGRTTYSGWFSYSMFLGSGDVCLSFAGLSHQGLETSSDCHFNTWIICYSTILVSVVKMFTLTTCVYLWCMWC